MRIEDKLSVEEMKLIADYVKAATNRALYPVLDEYFTPWFKAKSEYLFKLFGDNLIIDCGEIEYSKSTDELLSEVFHNEISLNYALMNECREELFTLLCKVLFPEGRLVYPSYPVWDATDEEIEEFAILETRYRFCNSVRLLFNEGALLENKAKFNATCTLLADPKHKIVVQYDTRIFRAVDNILKTIDRVHPGVYVNEIASLKTKCEKLRIEISQILNTRTVKGRLKLSIHPLDYLTISDNDNDWRSCMALYHPDETYEMGCYSAGTISMMNSKNAVVAYLESSTPFNLYGAGTWNNKKWRELVVVDEMLITPIKGYPYENNDLNMAITSKIKQLVSYKLGWEYEDIQKRNHGRISFNNDEMAVSLETSIMYNDSDYPNVYCLSIHAKEIIEQSDAIHGRYPLYYDGPAYCLECNYPIERDGLPFCDDCTPVMRCSCCGDQVSEDDYWTGDWGEILCEDCFRDTHTYCECCEHEAHEDNSCERKVIFDKDAHITEYTFYELCAFVERDGEYRLSSIHDNMCPDCIKHAIDSGYIVPAYYEEVFNDPDKWTAKGTLYFVVPAVFDNDIVKRELGIHRWHYINNDIIKGWTVIDPTTLAPHIDFIKNL